MKLSDRVRLTEGERIVTAWAERACGPGWSNQLVWILVHHAPTNVYRVVDMQSDEMSCVVSDLFSIAAVVSHEFTAAVRFQMGDEKR